MLEFAQRLRTTRHGVPIATTPAGMSRVTTLPAAMMESSPTETPGNTIAAAPIQTFDPIETGRASSKRSRRSSGSRGWSAARSCTPDAICVPSPIVTGAQSKITALKLMNTWSPICTL